MIDGIKIVNLGIEPEIFLNNELLDFPQSISEKTGEILNKKRTIEYKGLIITITPENVVKISGSLHKYSNNGYHNHNDFTYSDLLNVIVDLWRLFSINPANVVLNNLEFGVNVEVPFNPNLFIDNLIHFKRTCFNVVTRNKQKYAESLKNRYILKIYNKGLQYGLETNILRYEIKVIRSEHLKQFDIKHLHDILNLEKLDILKKDLVESFKDIVYWNPGINEDRFPTKQKELLKNGKSLIYWNELYQAQRRTYYNKLKSFRELVDQYGEFPFHSIPDQINSKWDQLLNFSTKDLRKLTEFENELQIPKIAQINISNKLLIRANNNSEIERKCLVTGLDISMQKRGSKFLCTTGIKYIYENDKSTFEILEKRLTDKWENESLEVRINEIHHSIRNESNNARNNLKTAINRINKYPTLFPVNDFIDPEKKILIS